ncbi:hypothetical protein ACTXT7_011953 [Hymenolepis weldensis]
MSWVYNATKAGQSNLGRAGTFWKVWRTTKQSLRCVQRPSSQSAVSIRGAKHFSSVYINLPNQ